MSIEADNLIRVLMHERKCKSKRFTTDSKRKIVKVTPELEDKLFGGRR